MKDRERRESRSSKKKESQLILQLLDGLVTVRRKCENLRKNTEPWVLSTSR